VAFGSMNYGLKSASKYYFDREPRNLTKAEQIALLIIPKDAQKYNPYQKPKNFRTRFETVTQTLRNGEIITDEEYQTILSEKLSWNIENGNSLPYVTDFLSTKIAANS
jgi:membrane peptidoglycan carboxypeptidase